MCKLFDEWTLQIKNYCENNNLSFEKVKSMSRCWGKDDLALQYYDKSIHNSEGVKNDIPMPIVLKIIKTDNGLVFEQTKYTKKYLAKEWVAGTLKEAPFWRDGMTPEEYDEENLYLQKHWDDYMNDNYEPLWKQKS